MTISLAADVLLSHTVHFLSLLFLYPPPKYPPPSIQSSGHLSQSPGPQVKLDPPTAQAWSPPLWPVYPLPPPLAVPGSSCGVYLGFVWRKDSLNIPLSANKVTSDLLKLAMKEMHFYKSTVSFCPPSSLPHLPWLVPSDPCPCGAHSGG